MNLMKYFPCEIQPKDGERAVEMWSQVLMLEEIKMKTIFDGNYHGHNIKVTTKWNGSFLIIDDVVLDSKKAIVAINVKLSGSIPGKDIQINYAISEKGHLLTANGKLIAKKDIYGNIERLNRTEEMGEALVWSDEAVGELSLKSEEKHVRLPIWGWVPLGLCLLMPLVMGFPVSIRNSVVFILLTGLLFIGSKLLEKKVSVRLLAIPYFATYMRSFPLFAVIALAGAFLCARIIKSNLSISSKVLLSILVTLAVWILPVIVGALRIILGQIN